MAKGAYIGVDGVARKVKKGYVGVDGLARKIKKAYIGIGGVARPCWSGGELTYWGTATDLTSQRGALAATTIGDYALFAGGRSDTYSTSTVNYHATVDCYDIALTKCSVNNLPSIRGYSCATTVGDYALIAGGRTKTAVLTAVIYYDSLLTRGTSTTGLTKSKYEAGATTVGNYAIIAGGSDSNGYSLSNVDAFNTSLTRTQLTALSLAWTKGGCTTVGDYALFGGGSQYFSGSNSTLSAVWAYNSSLTYQGVIGTLEQYHGSSSATTVGEYAIFEPGNSNVAYAFDTALTKIAVSAATTARRHTTAVTVKNFALFAGGQAGYSLVECFDDSLTMTIATPLSTGRWQSAAAAVGNYALICGGVTQDNFYYAKKIVDVYTVV